MEEKKDKGKKANPAKNMPDKDLDIILNYQTAINKKKSKNKK